jgi:hypothetical protein
LLIKKNQCYDFFFENQCYDRKLNIISPLNDTFEKTIQLLTNFGSYNLIFL